MKSFWTKGLPTDTIWKNIALGCINLRQKKLILKNKSIYNQCGAIRREFEPVGPTLLKTPLGAGRCLLPTL